MPKQDPMIVKDMLVRDTERLAYAYAEQCLGDAARITERMIVTLMELMEDQAGRKIDFSGILNRAS